MRGFQEMGRFVWPCSHGIFPATPFLEKTVGKWSNFGRFAWDSLKNNFQPPFFPINFRKRSSTVEVPQQNAYFRWATANNAGKKKLLAPDATTNNMNLTCTSGHKRKKKKNKERSWETHSGFRCNRHCCCHAIHFACMYTLIHTSSTTVQLNHCQDDTASMTQKKCQRIRFGIKLVPKVVPFSGTTLHKDSLLWPQFWSQKTGPLLVPLLIHFNSFF